MDTVIISFKIHLIIENIWGASVFLIAHEILTAQSIKCGKPAARRSFIRTKEFDCLLMNCTCFGPLYGFSLSMCLSLVSFFLLLFRDHAPYFVFISSIFGLDNTLTAVAFAVWLF